jgi:hypothetical protein
MKYCLQEYILFLCRPPEGNATTLLTYIIFRPVTRINLVSKKTTNALSLMLFTGFFMITTQAHPRKAQKFFYFFKMVLYGFVTVEPEIIKIPLGNNRRAMVGYNA